MTDHQEKDTLHQGRDDYFMDIDRMVNEGLGGGAVSPQNGLIEESTTDTMRHPESSLEQSDSEGEQPGMNRQSAGKEG